MLKNIDESAKWVPDMEPSDTPRLADGAVLHGDLAFLNTTQCLIKIVHFDRQIRHWRAEPPWFAKLTCTVILAEPAYVRIQP